MEISVEELNSGEKYRLKFEKKSLQIFLSDLSVFSVFEQYYQLDIPSYIPYLDIINAVVDTVNHILQIKYVFKKTIESCTFSFDNECETKEEIELFCNNLLDKVYENGKSESKSIYVIINPYSGNKKAESVFKYEVLPILEAGDCTVDFIMTKKAGDGQIIARNIPLQYYDKIMCVSGDGLLHEVANGLLGREDYIKWKTPLCVIPLGTGNALANSLMSKELYNHTTVSYAIMNALKGRKLQMDVMDVKLEKKNGDVKKMFSLSSQTYGLIADADIGTNYLRYFSSFRFTLGALWNIISNKKYVAVIDIENYNMDQTEIKVFSAGKTTRLDANTIINPKAKMSDGFIDINIIPFKNHGSFDYSKIFLEVSTGNHIWHPLCVYKKVKEYALYFEDNSLVSIDGEEYSCSSMKVSVASQKLYIMSIENEFT